MSLIKFMCVLYVSRCVSSDCFHGQKTLTPADSLEYCLYSASHGFPLTKPHVLAHALAIYNHRHTESPKLTLGQAMWIHFRERQKHCLTAQTPDIIDRGRACCAKRWPIEEAPHPQPGGARVEVPVSYTIATRQGFSWTP